MKKNKIFSIQNKTFIYWALLNTISPIWQYFSSGYTDFFISYISSLLITSVFGFILYLIQIIIDKISSKKTERNFVKYLLNGAVIWALIIIITAIAENYSRQWEEENSELLEKLEYNYKNQE